MSRPHNKQPNSRHLVLDNTSARTTTGTSIEEGEFSEYRTLETVQIQSSSNITSIGDGAFRQCISLQSISIPENITSIGDYAFCYCTSLQSISIPESVTSIGNYAFGGCESLQSIHLSESFTSIGDFAFFHCKALQSISIPESVTSIGNGAFGYCRSLNRRLPNGCNYHDDTETWLRQRFNDLPIHQACYHFGNNTQQHLNHLSTLINENRQSLATTDAMGMTALHILCCNPHATTKMVQLLVDNDPSVLSLQDVTGSTPLKLFLACRGLLNDHDADTEQELLMPSLHDLLRKGIKSKDLEILFYFNSDLEAEATLANPDENTKLKPFMSAATFLGCGLDMVYALAMKNLNAVVER